jgi:divalent metal cation (Fe/Co/Zn/Cd) transporter
MLPIRPIRALYIIGVFFVGIFLLGFIWFVLYYAWYGIQGAIAQHMTSYYTDSTYATFELAHQFMINLWQYMLVIVFFILLYWMYIYSQRKGERYA